jgi:hypothetical protein
MDTTDWLRMRGIELLAACATAGVLIGGLAAGLPYLRDRIPEVFLYSVCCIGAVVLRAALDLLAQGVLFSARLVWHFLPARFQRQAPATA